MFKVVFSGLASFVKALSCKSAARGCLSGRMVYGWERDRRQEMSDWGRQTIAAHTSNLRAAPAGRPITAAAAARHAELSAQLRKESATARVVNPPNRFSTVPEFQLVQRHDRRKLLRSGSDDAQAVANRVAGMPNVQAGMVARMVEQTAALTSSIRSYLTSSRGETQRTKSVRFTRAAHWPRAAAAMASTQALQTSSYDGDRKNGRMEGHGKYTFPSGSIYTGQLLDGEFHGQGVLEYPGAAAVAPASLDLALFPSVVLGPRPEALTLTNQTRTRP